MIRKLALFFAAAAAFGLQPLSRYLGPFVGSAVALLLGMGLAVAASSADRMESQGGSPGAGSLALPAAGGALGALAAAVLAGFSPAAGGAALVGFAFAERTSRIEGARARAGHVALALGSGALAGWITASYLTGALSVQAVSVVMAGILVGLPLLLDADDPTAHALAGLASAVPEPSRSALLEGAELRRAAFDVPLDRKTAREVRQTWRALLDLGEARVRLTRMTAGQVHAVAKKLDARIAEHVRALTRALTAVDAARAAEVGLNDAALRNVETVGESYEHVSKTLMDEA
ncbi:MAG: hypothetical protein L6Q76_10055 [Polyangiaceae bacterium]|nr:hypothetical protein [Polyangiaceae bacterium]